MSLPRQHVMLFLRKQRAPAVPKLLGAAAQPDAVVDSVIYHWQQRLKEPHVIEGIEQIDTFTGGWTSEESETAWFNHAELCSSHKSPTWGLAWPTADGGNYRLKGDQDIKTGPQLLY